MNNTFIYISKSGGTEAIRIESHSMIALNQLCIYTLEPDGKYKFVSTIDDWKRVRVLMFDRMLVDFVDSVLGKYFAGRY
jgi:hypothetical protein